MTMAFNGLQDFVSRLDSDGELQRVKAFTDPVLEIAELADRMVKNGRRALLFENTGTDFPLLINAFASDKRMMTALHRPSLDDAADEIISLFNSFGGENSLLKKLSDLPRMARLMRVMPRRSSRRGICQEVTMAEPDLGRLPVLKCWPYDGGRFITLPLVHTRHPLTGKTNVGMYRMQVMGPGKTGMHWHRHKTGARHFEAWKTRGERMPVTVTLGGDPVYTYAATAPMPENIDEYLLAGFLRRKKVKLVKCLTNDLWVPADSDFVIEGYVDPAEEPVWEGPFGDHTGFYSLADWYPAFHITCITHRRDAVYPATIVGVPPMEDAWIGRATERIFLAPIKVAIAPEIENIHMPFQGVAHNLVIVKIKKEYPGQGLKVLNSLFGAGQMMFSKYIIVVSGTVSADDYPAVAASILRNADLSYDMVQTRGPMDILDHSSDSYSFGGKLGIDATEKLPEELTPGRRENIPPAAHEVHQQLSELSDDFAVYDDMGFVVAVIPVDRDSRPFNIKTAIESLPLICSQSGVLTLFTDRGMNTGNRGLVAWYALGNTDPGRDMYRLTGGGIVLNATRKADSVTPFPRQWPNVVCSADTTIKSIDSQWAEYDIGNFLSSPSLELKGVETEGDAVAAQKF